MEVARCACIAAQLQLEHCSPQGCKILAAAYSPSPKCRPLPRSDTNLVNPILEPTILFMGTQSQVALRFLKSSWEMLKSTWVIPMAPWRIPCRLEKFHVVLRNFMSSWEISWRLKTTWGIPWFWSESRRLELILRLSEGVVWGFYFCYAGLCDSNGCKWQLWYHFGCC